MTTMETSTTNYFGAPPAHIQASMQGMQTSGVSKPSAEHLPWVEKYRPATIDDVAQQEEVVSSLQAALKTGDLPNLLFYGPPGTGKTSVATALCRQFFGKEYKSRVKELNASDERGINAIREHVKVFAQLAVGGDGLKYNFRIVILDEADSMTHDAQAALRRIMEEFVHVTRFIIICNYVSKIIEPLHSRCSKFRFRPIDKEFQKKRIFHICEQEKVAISGDSLEALISYSKGDMRAAVTMLQTASEFYGTVDENAIVEIACAVPERRVLDLFEAAKKGTEAQLQSMLKDFLCDGFSGSQMLEQLIDPLLSDKSVDDAAKTKCTLLFSEVSHRLTEGCDEELQLLHFFTQMRKHLKK